MTTDRARETFESRLTSAEAALAAVRPGDHVFVGTACATPRTLVRALENLDRPLDDVQLVHFLTTGAVESGPDGPQTRFGHTVFFVGSDSRELVRQGRADYVPVSLARVPSLIESGRIKIDVALIQVSPPDEHGFVSLGVSVDVVHAAVRRARTVIAEVNPRMPRTLGDSFVAVERIASFVPVDHPVIEYVHEPADAVAERIARYVARIIDDGSTLQIGLGRIPNEMLKYLTHRRDLGIHSDVITDPLVDLVERGVVTGRQKSLHPGKIVASWCMGTERLYRMLDRNPLFSLHPIEYVADPEVLARNRKFASVTQAFAVDLTGQVCADQFQGEFYGGVAAQADFLRGAAASPEGKPILCLPSTTDDGQTSRIRTVLQAGEAATIPRSDVHYVVTEWGSAYLFGRSIRDRALALIEIAHPSFRPGLLAEAKRLGYLRPDQTLKSLVAYPEEEEREATLKGGRRVLLRPARASDVNGVQDIFYKMGEHDVYTRFFTRLTSLSVSRAEYLCNVDYENEMAFVAVHGDAEESSIVGSSCYYVNHTTNLAEVAYMMRPEWQGCGLGSALHRRMAEYAKSKGLRGFTADVLVENVRMRRLFENVSPNVSVERDGDVFEIRMLFA
ncbi:MAG: GNAT family N-acetyltransferase [Deltaproteobacteria bacterium]|nr:GNAT family N-acetyltransferase [Deltaproteobacteria bacterium]